MGEWDLEKCPLLGYCVLYLEGPLSEVVLYIIMYMCKYWLCKGGRSGGNREWTAATSGGQSVASHPGQEGGKVTKCITFKERLISSDACNADFHYQFALGFALLAMHSSHTHA